MKQIEKISTQVIRKSAFTRTRSHEVNKLLSDIAKARLSCEITAYALAIDEELLGPTRGAPDAALARQLAMYLCHVGFGMSLQRVASAFGRDRSTIAYACHLIEDKRDDAKFDNFTQALENALTAVPNHNPLL